MYPCAIFTSIPPAVALTIFKQHQPEEAVAFAARLQKAIYYEGIKPTDYEAYGKLAEEFGLNAASFTAQMQENESLQQATIFLEHNGQYTVLGRGYMPLERLEAAFEQVAK